MYTHVLWDFNGTILDDVAVGIDSVNVLLRKRGISELSSVEQYRKAFGFPIIEYYKRIGFDFSKEPFSKVAVEWVDEYLSRVPSAKVNAGALEMLGLFKKSGLKQILVSATEEKMLKKQLADLGLLSFFDEILGLDNIHAVDKTSVAKAWRERNKCAKAIFVGDTDHDFETARAVDAECVLYSGGHQSVDRLKKLGAKIIGELSELESIVLG